MGDDDGITPCCFGPTCRLGHSKRVVVPVDETKKLEYWRKYKADYDDGGASPAFRDATLLRSQLEPWPTAVLRDRLGTVFGEDMRELDPLSRGELMRRLLEHYNKRTTSTNSNSNSNSTPRTMIRVKGSPVPEDLCHQLLEALQAWRARHNTNARPSIKAKSYMILRSPREFMQKLNSTSTTTNEDGSSTSNNNSSNKAKQAAKKLAKHQHLWDLAHEAIHQVDAEYAANFSALAVTYGFVGSPHIDKQNTGPFYGLAVGDFDDETGGICVESSPFVVAHVNTKNQLGKVDGRFPHWVAPYDPTKDRYSLIYYSTWQDYEIPVTPFFGPVVVPEEEVTN
jgi:hypothetical protein